MVNRRAGEGRGKEEVGDYDPPPPMTLTGSFDSFESFKKRRQTGVAPDNRPLFPVRNASEWSRMHRHFQLAGCAIHRPSKIKKEKYNFHTTVLTDCAEIRFRLFVNCVVSPIVVAPPNEFVR